MSVIKYGLSKPHSNSDPNPNANPDWIGGVIKYGVDASITFTPAITGTGTLGHSWAVTASQGVAKFDYFHIDGKGAPGSKSIRFTPSGAGACNCLTYVESGMFNVKNARCQNLPDRINNPKPNPKSQNP